MSSVNLKALLQWELKKYKNRGYGNIPALFGLIAFFYYIPRLFFYLFSLLQDPDQYQIYTLVTYSVHLLAYFLGNLLFFPMYYTNLPIFQSLKITPDPWPWQSDPNFKEMLKKTLKVALINQVITVPLSLLITGLTAKYQLSQVQPEMQEVVLQVAVCCFVEDLCFYCTHRLLHVPWLYKRIHKQHHEYNVTISIAAEYAHPIEYLLGNSLPVAAGPMLLGQRRMHIITWFTWVFYRTLTTCEGHSGYEIPWSPLRYIPFSSTPTYHDYHHNKNVGNFSSFSLLWDTVFGTNAKFFKHISEKKIE